MSQMKYAKSWEQVWNALLNEGMELHAPIIGEPYLCKVDGLEVNKVGRVTHCQHWTLYSAWTDGVTMEHVYSYRDYRKQLWQAYRLCGKNTDEYREKTNRCKNVIIR